LYYWEERLFNDAGYEAVERWDGHREKSSFVYLLDIGYVQLTLLRLTVKDGKRHSVAAAFLVPILDRPNLTVQTGALATRLLFEGTRTVGVEYLHEGTLHHVHVDREVILSAGAFDSPKLLMLSGIGNAEYLRLLNIPVVADLPGVGQTCQRLPQEIRTHPRL
jgi:choline dehydrogenase-like flavoprotein